MTPEKLDKLRALGYEFDSAYDDIAERHQKQKDLIQEKKTVKLELPINEENLFAFKYDDKSITINKIKYTYEIILKKITLIKKRLSSVNDELSDEEKLILDLPLIEWKLGFKHGGVFILLWLEGLTDSVKLDYDFFMSNTRVKDVDKISLKDYFKNIKYLSSENLGYMPSNPDAENFFLFDDSIPSVKKSLDLFNKNLKNLKNNTIVGNFDGLDNLVKNKIRDNYFMSFSIGSGFGDLDKIGAALGRYSYRVYFKGFLNKNIDSNKWILNIDEIAGRFIDEFTFKDDSLSYNPKTWKSQSLGCWSPSLKEADVSRLKVPIFSDKICLENQDFISLKNKALKKGIKIGGDFLIYSNIKIFKDNFVEKEILIQ